MSVELTDRIMSLVSKYLMFGVIGCGIVFLLTIVVFFLIIHKIMRRM